MCRRSTDVARPFENGFAKGHGGYWPYDRAYIVDKGLPYTSILYNVRAAM